MLLIDFLSEYIIYSSKLYTYLLNKKSISINWMFGILGPWSTADLLYSYKWVGVFDLLRRNNGT